MTDKLTSLISEIEKEIVMKCRLCGENMKADIKEERYVCKDRKCKGKIKWSRENDKKY